jgi:uncharacterized protein YjdB
MASETVRVYAIDEVDAALEGVLVRVFDDGDVFVTQNTTSIVGGDAYAEFTLDGDDPPVDYTIRLSKLGVAFDGLLGTDSQTPQAIEVYSPPAQAPSGTNDFTVQGQTFTRPVATDPRLCRASGYFKDIAGRALADLSIHFLNLNSPTVVDGDAILGSEVWGQTDDDGYFVLDLYRGAEYRASIESLEIQLRVVVVPDASSVNLVHLLFPVVASVTYDPASVSVAVGDYEDVDLTITDTAGVEHDLEDGDILLTIEDDTVASGAIADGLMRITGVASGSTTMTVARADTSIVIVDEPVLASLSITVT